MMIAMEGPDRCGKSEIAKALAVRLGCSYFKNSGEWNTDLRTSEYFKNLLTYGGTLMTDFLCQVKPNVILDRYYPSEWVYSSVFGRESNERLVKSIDEKFSDAGGKIVICRRKSYDGITDDLHRYVDSHLLEKLDHGYDIFSKLTKCQVLTLWVDDENLDRELEEIIDWLR